MSACSEPRDESERAVIFDDVDALLQSRCLECHFAELAEADYRVEDYLASIGCVSGGLTPAALPADESAPILAVLDQADHTGLLDEAEQAFLTAWVLDGALRRYQGSHPPGIIDPRSADWHGTYLRTTEWRPIVDPSREDACGICHEGSPAPVERVTVFAPGATSCTDCHNLPDGVMACGTCHGDGLRPFPPRDPCYFRGPPFGGAHLAHTEPSANAPQPLACQTCHFGEAYEVLEGRHANGEVDVVFQPAWGEEAAGYDSAVLTCDTTCHARGGATPLVAWDEQIEIGCDSCHQNPPAAHAVIGCNNCHRGINPEGSRLTSDAPHLNGRVDAF